MEQEQAGASKLEDGGVPSLPRTPSSIIPMWPRWPFAQMQV